MNLRFLPGFKLMSHRNFVDYFDGKFVYPINVEISLSGVCDAKCKDCFYRQDNKSLKGWDNTFFDYELMQELIVDLTYCGVKSISWTGGGEPTLHPNFKQITKIVNQHQIEQGLFTNALKKPTYDPTVFEWIRVTKTNYPLVEEHLMDLRKCKTVGICINFGKDDDEQIIYDALKIAEKLEENKPDESFSTYVQVRPALLIKGKSYHTETPNISHPLLYLTDYKFLGLVSEREYNKCEAYHFSPFIWQDGDVDVCAYHRKNSIFNLGNLYKESFTSIMKMAQKNVDVIDTCQTCCKLNEMNAIIDIRKNVKNINFP